MSSGQAVVATPYTCNRSTARVVSSTPLQRWDPPTRSYITQAEKKQWLALDLSSCWWVLHGHGLPWSGPVCSTAVGASGTARRWEDTNLVTHSP